MHSIHSYLMRVTFQPEKSTTNTIFSPFIEGQKLDYTSKIFKEIRGIFSISTECIKDLFEEREKKEREEKLLSFYARRMMGFLANRYRCPEPL